MRFQGQSGGWMDGWVDRQKVPSLLIDYEAYKTLTWPWPDNQSIWDIIHPDIPPHTSSIPPPTSSKSYGFRFPHQSGQAATKRFNQYPSIIETFNVHSLASTVTPILLAISCARVTGGKLRERISDLIECSLLPSIIPPTKG